MKQHRQRIRSRWLMGWLLVVIAWSAEGCAKTIFAGAAKAPMAVRQAGSRAVVRSGSLSLRAKELEPIKIEIDRMIDASDGWVESWSLTDGRRLHMTVRVPEPRLDLFMDRVAALGKLVSRSLHSRDVTEQLIDLKARLTNLRALRDRLRSYLDRAGDLKEILAVERELVRVQTEIDALEAKLELLKNQVAMASLDIAVKRR